ncbi:non-ribosomal peptide synthase domain TIGR01720/amino acid adenylation domain-containing protein [Clostridium cavendishii DSM 21758]|uniref:Non-ribosomal peptide synthase domain TIGR01720/amino acid adenylation domain-containing protein n=1 Tax=Clostridium cavendishii DSM 21758 TaxID=1121302 RepID=A0A1M6NTT2_9CLOT|nr:non-ribosomal peptide synthetase [Clostridium cavendishii]SHJ99133.1 non-ribosomal peptide synthase domain TIGR01720/amino acid adenylation domain-containing protein [Clostridium cavendishii DSM 21758]
MKKEDIEDILELTGTQEGILYHYIMDKDSLLYQEQLSIEISGVIDTELMKNAWEQVVKYNEALRTIVKWKKIKKPVQIVLKTYSTPVEIIDLSNIIEDKKEETFSEIYEKKRKELIDIENETVKFYICKFDDNLAKIIIKNHHITYDGWSNGIILKEFIKMYNAILKGEKIEEQNKNKFKNYIKWLKDKNKEKDELYWKRYLEKIEYIKKVDFEKDSKSISNFDCKISEEMENNIRSYAKNKKVSQASIFYCAWIILQSKYKNTNDIVFGTPVSGRDCGVIGINDMVGLFINTIPFRIKIHNNNSIFYLIQQINENLNERRMYETTSLKNIKEYSEVNGNYNIFEEIVVIENYPLDKILYDDDIAQIKGYKISENCEFNLVIELNTFDCFEIKVAYNDKVYQEYYIKNMVKSLISILNEIICNDKIILSDLEIISKEEKEKILYEFNNTSTDYPRNKTIQQLFEEQVKKIPNKLAVTYEDKKITYRELNEKANSLAKALIEKGIEADNVVGIMLERSIDSIIGILGILKAGGAYLPIDIEYPKLKIKYMLENSNIRLLITNYELIELLDYKGEIIDINDEKIYKNKSNNLEETSNSQNLAYVIYTSGTTGDSKGVMIEHKSVINLVYALDEIIYKRYPKYVNVALLAPFVFDASVKQIFASLLLGKNLVIVPNYIKSDAYKLRKYYIDKSIYISDGTPIHLKMLNVVVNKEESNNIPVKHFIIGGDCLSSRLVKEFFYANGEKCFITNVYGPTECCVDTTSLLIEESKVKEINNITIGRPINNSKVYILDQTMKLLPIGIVGEIFISGEGLARGYLNNGKLTKEKFLENPYAPGEKMYKTGDLARWLPDGNIEFFGRIDHQVKIRGFRIELGEIETRLLEVEEIKEVVVVDKEKNGDKYICAYYVGDKNYTVSELRTILGKSLPEYMIPSYFMKLENMPLNINGKLDRKSLPTPEGDIIKDSVYEAPRNEVEKVLVKIWEEVLGVDNIGINDNFFELGGHSLKGTLLMGRIHKELNVEVPLRELLTLGTVKGIGEYIKSKESRVYEQIEKTKEKEYYVASAAQKRIYILQEFDKESTAYNISGAIEIEGKLNTEKLTNTFLKLIERHESLRTKFETINGIIIQKIKKIEEIDFRIKEIKVKDKAEVKEKISNFIKCFDLSRAPLLRVGLIELEKERYILMFDIHHIISDGISMEILKKEFGEIYGGKELENLKIQYKDYSEWQSKMRQREILKKQEHYWLREFDGEIPVLNIPTDYNRPLVQSFVGDSINFIIGKEETKRLREIARETGSTMYMVLFSLFKILLSKYSGQEDIIVGTPIAGRPHADLEGIIGMFVNTLAIRSNINVENTYEDYLRKLREKLLNAYENQDYQFEDIVEKLNVKRDISRNPLFDIMFAMQNMESSFLEIKELKVKPYTLESNISKFDMSMTAVEDEDEICLILEYSIKLYKKETIERIKEHFLNLVKTITINSNIKVKDIEIIDNKEKTKLLLDFNDTTSEYQINSTIQQLFEEQVKRIPNNIAVVYEDDEITYEELNKRANSLARTLIEKGVKADSIVGIMLDRSIEMIIGIMGILKAGGAYLPIDMKYPQSKIDYIIDDSKIEVLITNGKLMSLVNYNGELINIDDEEIFINNSNNLSETSRPENLAYVIYTSGTTGNAKGVMVEHKSVVNLVYSLNKMVYKRYPKYINVALVAAFVFDASVQQIFASLLLGKNLIIVPDDSKRDLYKLRKYYIDKSIYVSDGTPIHLAMLNVMVNDEKIKNIPVKHFIIGGDQLKKKTVKEFFNVNGEKKCITNVYGPTECCVDTTSLLIEGSKINKMDDITIGCPITNSKVYILDKSMKLLPIGIVGEIFISGEGLARGYLNNEKLTNEKFLENPYVPGERIYRTGDVGRWLPDGNIEFLGRIDNQVKIRGFRIELGEIETRLLEIQGIKEVIVLDKEKDDNKYLCAYYVGEKRYTVNEFRDILGKRLPDYMIPSYFIKLESMPLNTNGKIARKLLPNTEENIIIDSVYEAPLTKVEKKLVEIWQEVLGVKNIGINDNFFYLGGDSIKAIQTISRIKSEGYSFEVKDLFRNPNIKDLSKYVTKEATSINQGFIEGEVLLTPIQKQFFEMNLKNRNHWNQSVMLYSKQGFEEELINKIFDKIIRHHDSLRMVYKENSGKVHQINRGIYSDVNDVKVYDFRGDEIVDESKITNLCNKIQESIDLNDGPLVKLALVKTDSGDYLQIVIHHLVIDGVSWRIIFEDFEKGYEMAKRGKKIVLPRKTTSFKEWAEKLNQYRINNKFRTEINFWNTLEGQQIKKLPKDKEVEERYRKDIKTITVSLSENDTETLLKKVNRAYNTEINDILLTALTLAIYRWTGENKVLINLESHGREDIIDKVDISRTIGWFTAQYPVILEVDKYNEISVSIKNVKECLRRIPNKGIGYGILKYLSSTKQNEKVDFKLQPEICFNYLGQFDEDINSSFFELSVVDNGNNISLENISLYSLDILAIVIKKSLRISISYSIKEYNEEKIRSLIMGYKDNILKIIEHCNNVKKDEVTISDITSEDISKDELDDYMNKLML